MTLEQCFSTVVLLTLGPGHSYGGCPVHCWLFSSIPGLYLPDCQEPPSLSSFDNQKRSPDIVSGFLGGKITPTESQCTKSKWPKQTTSAIRSMVWGRRSISISPLHRGVFLKHFYAKVTFIQEIMGGEKNNTVWKNTVMYSYSAILLFWNHAVWGLKDALKSFHFINGV